MESWLCFMFTFNWSFVCHSCKYMYWLPGSPAGDIVWSEMSRTMCGSFSTTFMFPEISWPWWRHEMEIFCALLAICSFPNRLFRRRSKKTSKLHVTGLCEGNSLPRRKGRERGKRFHLMTSSWFCDFSRSSRTVYPLCTRKGLSLSEKWKIKDVYQPLAHCWLGYLVFYVMFMHII